MSLLNTDEMADTCGVHVNTIRNWINDGDLPATKFGRQWKITEAALNNWIASKFDNRLSA